MNVVLEGRVTVKGGVFRSAKGTSGCVLTVFDGVDSTQVYMLAGNARRVNEDDFVKLECQVRAGKRGLEVLGVPLFI